MHFSKHIAIGCLLATTGAVIGGLGTPIAKALLTDGSASPLSLSMLRIAGTALVFWALPSGRQYVKLRHLGLMLLIGTLGIAPQMSFVQLWLAPLLPYRGEHHQLMFGTVGGDTWHHNPTDSPCTLPTPRHTAHRHGNDDNHIFLWRRKAQPKPYIGQRNCHGLDAGRRTMHRHHLPAARTLQHRHNI